MIKTANNVWVNLLKTVMNEGYDIKIRGSVTLECISQTSIIDMNLPYVDIPERKIGKKFRYAEAAWILSGDNKVSTIAPYCKTISQFSDDGYYFRGAYGPHIISQLPYIIHLLRKDPSTRQAVISIWNRSPGYSIDIPCTLSIQFLIRNNKINTVVSMRSSDLWLGWPYDVHNFSMLTVYVILHLKKYELGNLYLTAGSQHIYIRDWESCKNILKREGCYKNRVFNLDRSLNPQGFINRLWEYAND